MIYKFQNFSFTIPQLQDGDVLEMCNLSQKTLTLFDGQGAESVTVKNCNCFNCDFPVSWIIEGGNTAKRDCCYWLHENWDLPVEEENCRHVVDTDEIYVDDILVETIYLREDIVI